MERARDPRELRELLGAYALGAVDADEHAEVEAYVLHDADARAELHQLEHAAAWLGHASPRPSPAAWDSVRAGMERDLAAAVAAAPVARESTRSAPVVDLTTSRPRPRWARMTAIAAGVALVLAAGAAALGVLSGGSAPTRTVALAAADGRVELTARVHADGTGTIVTSSLPGASRGHEYQLWSQAGPGAPMRSAGLLGSDPDGHRIRVPTHTHRLAVSMEPSGGSAAPTTAPVAVSRADPL